MKIIFTIFLFQSVLAFGQYYEVGDNLNVNARSGLNVRNEPGAKGSKVGFLQYGQKVKVISKEFINKRDTFDNLDGGWIEIEAGETRGYVFDGFLTKLPVVKIDSQNTHWSYCLFEQMEAYAFDNFSNITKSNYNNGNDGEGAHSFTIFTSDKNYQFVEHSYTECLARELQIPNLRRSEGILLLKSFFQNCNLLNDEIE